MKRDCESRKMEHKPGIETYYRDLPSSEGPRAMFHWSHASNNPLARDYTGGMNGPGGLCASSPGRLLCSGPDVVALLAQDHCPTPDKLENVVMRPFIKLRANKHIATQKSNNCIKDVLIHKVESN